MLGLPVASEFLPTRTGDVQHSWADCTEARQLLGWEPVVDLEEGLRLTVARAVAAANVE